VIRFYRGLLRLYPAGFRAEYASEMAAAYEERVRESGPVGAALAAITDVVPNAIAAHWAILAQDLHYTARSLRGSRAFAIATIIVTALGVGATTAVFSVADFVLLRPLGFPEPDRLVRMCNAPRQGGGWGCNNQLAPARFITLQSENASFESIGAFARGAVNLVGSAEPARLVSAAVTPEVLPTLGVRPFIGRWFDTTDPAQDLSSVVLSHALWQSQFGGDDAIVGTQLRLDDAPYVVIGVMPAAFNFPTEEAQLWTPLIFTAADRTERINNTLEVVGRLRAGVTFEQARADVEAIGDRIAAEFPETDGETGWSFFRQRDEMSPRYRQMLIALCGASLCMLLLTCANLANLLLARAAGRERELAVRTALGAGRERLVRQMLTEAAVLALLGGVAGALLAALVTPLLAQLVPTTMPLASRPAVDGRIFAIAVSLSALTGLGFGLLPAVRAGRDDMFAALRGGARGGARGQRLRTALVAVEVAMSVVLLTASGLLIRAMLSVQAVPSGFVADDVLTLRTALPLPRYEEDARRQEFYRRVLADVRALPGVDAAGYISALPMVMTGGITRVLLPGETAQRGNEQSASWRIISPGYVAAMSIPVRTGRDLMEADGSSAPLVAVVSESFVQTRLGGRDAIGQTITMRDQTRTIVGVVGDVRVRGLERTNEPQVYVPYTQPPVGLQGRGYQPQDLVVRSRRAADALVPAIREVVRQVDPQQPVSHIRMLSEVVGQQTAARRTQVQVLGALAGLALLLAAVGIHGLLAFTVAQRDREIGVRLALGADPSGVGRMIVGEGVRLALLGVIPGAIAAWLAGRAMRGLLFGVPTLDPLTLGIVAGLCFLTTVVACVAPALRAARISPMTALRAE
jgi:predicted permease